MARTKLTLLILPEDSKKFSQLRVSNILIFSLASFVFLSSLALCAILYDYYKLKRAMPNIQALNDEILNQRVQIQAFSKRINTLKSQISLLRDFEKKIRILTNLDQSHNQEAVFGVGGSALGDLRARFSVNEKQDYLMRKMHEEMDQLYASVTIQEKSFRELYKYLEKQESILRATPSISPTVGWVSSGFGYRISPFTGLKEFHRGLDIAARPGTPVIAPADGIVSFCGNKGTYGKFMIIDHGYGIVTRYGHLKKFLVKPGWRVKRGDKIALVGNSGLSTGPHLHYEVLVDGIPVNPKKYILN
nr:M23 family peptidase [Desulfobacterales bacterium]